VIRSISLTVLTTGVVIASSKQDVPEPFQPFTPPAYRLINGVQFDGSESAMIFALLNRDVLAHRGRPDSTAAELGLFTSQRTAGGWTEPQLLPLSGSYPDYEPALAPDGSFLIFNSKRPWPDGRTPTRNDLHIAERNAGTWGQARPLPLINSFELEESYATVDSARRIIFVRGPVVEGGDDFDLYEFTLRPDGSTSEPSGLPFSGPEFGEGDPQLARDGSFVIFTRWDHRVGWQQTCDLYLSFRTPAGWTEPVALLELNTPAPDYAAALSPDGQWLYYRAGSRYLRRALRPVLDSAIARTR
jgi:hypothetical protein